MPYKVFWAAKHQKQLQPIRKSQIIFSVKIPKNGEELPCLSHKLRQRLPTKQNTGGVGPKPSKHGMAPIHWWWQTISRVANEKQQISFDLKCQAFHQATQYCVYICICDAQRSSVSLHWQRLKKTKMSIVWCYCCFYLLEATQYCSMKHMLVWSGWIKSLWRITRGGRAKS